MMLPKELREYDQIIVWDFEFANIGGAIYPTSLAYKNISTFLWNFFKRNLQKTLTSYKYLGYPAIPANFRETCNEKIPAHVFVYFCEIR